MLNNCFFGGQFCILFRNGFPSELLASLPTSVCVGFRDALEFVRLLRFSVQVTAQVYGQCSPKCLSSYTG